MKKNYTKTTLALFLAFTQVVVAQSPTWGWAKNAGSYTDNIVVGNATPQAVVKDALGNTYVAGTFEAATTKFDSIVLQNPSYSNSYSSDIFITKYNSIGKVVWAKRVGGINSNYGFENAKGLCIDLSGNIYLAGEFASDTLRVGSINLIKNVGGDVDLFIAKFDANGNAIWAKSAASTPNSSWASNNNVSSIAADKQGNVYISGYFLTPTITFGATTLNNADANNGYTELFIAKYSSSGTPIWATRAGGADDDYANSISVDKSGNIYVSGYTISSSISFGSTTLTGAGVFVAKYDNSGAAIWAKKAGSAYDNANSIATDTLGNVFAAGYFYSANITFGATTLTNAQADTADMFFVKYDGNGTELFAKSIGGAGGQVPTAIRTDLTGNVFITGGYNSSAISFGATTLMNDSITADNFGTNDVFLVKYDNSGTALWAKGTGAKFSDEISALAVDLTGNVSIVGTGGALSFDGGSSFNYGGMFLTNYNNNGALIFTKDNRNIERNNGGSDVTTSIITDALGNIYTYGNYTGQKIILGTDTVKNNKTFYKNILITKQNPQGSLIWAKTEKAGGNFNTTAICKDASGHLYITGSFDGDSVTIGTTTLYNMDPLSYQGDVFIAKYDTSGNALWAKSARGSGPDIANSIATDLSGAVYITGTFEGDSIVFSNTKLIDTNPSTSDVFVVKYDANGALIWAKSAGGQGDDFGLSVATNSLNNVCVAGYFASTAITFGTNTMNNADASGTNDIFLVQYDNTGAVLWTKREGGLNNDVAWAVSCDNSNNILMAGRFASTSISFSTTTLTNNGAVGSFDVYVAKYDASGNNVWAKSAGGSGPDRGNSIATDANGNVFLGGYFSSPSMAFGSDVLVPKTILGTYSTDVFVAKFNALGNIQWAKSAGGTGYDQLSAIAVNPMGDLYLAGYFQSTIMNFDALSIQNVDALNDYGNGDLFVAKLTEAIATNSTHDTNKNDKSLSIYPNPANDKFIIMGITEKTSIKMYDVFGKLVLLTELENDSVINTNSLNSGIYFLVSENKTQQTMNKIVISK